MYLPTGILHQIHSILVAMCVHINFVFIVVLQGGLYRDISLGIKDASIIVACISEQVRYTFNEMGVFCSRLSF